jgi:hypothetical protein
VLWHTVHCARMKPLQPFFAVLCASACIQYRTDRATDAIALICCLSQPPMRPCGRRMNVSTASTPTVIPPAPKQFHARKTEKVGRVPGNPIWASQAMVYSCFSAERHLAPIATTTTAAPTRMACAPARSHPARAPAAHGPQRRVPPMISTSLAPPLLLPPLPGPGGWQPRWRVRLREAPAHHERRSADTLGPLLPPLPPQQRRRPPLPPSPSTALKTPPVPAEAA